MDTSRKMLWSLIAIWMLASTFAVIACSINRDSAQLDGEYLPMGNDSFYHARRILDTVQDPSAFYEFDTKIHAPEGSLLTWPWGYDYAMATIARGALALGWVDDPMALLIWIPVAAVLISVALLITIARQIGLSRPLTMLAGLCLALTPTTQILHGVGFIDHHYAEFIFVLAALAAGLAWLSKPESPTRAAISAVILGLAPAVQNGLFILQLPLLITMFVLWLQGRSLPARSSLTFAATLLVTTILILLPSLPFRMGRFEFYTLSWFHLYIAVCSSVTVVLLSRLHANRKGLVTLGVISTALLIPILKELVIAKAFIGGTPEYLALIIEMRPPFVAAEEFGSEMIARYYSHLIWFAPMTSLVCAFRCYRERNTTRLLFWVTALIGIALLLTQIRLQYFGNFALYLPWLILLQEFCDQSPQHFTKATLLAGLALLVLYLPPLRHQLLAPLPRANDAMFRDIRPLLGSLAKACEKDPGIVLADTDISHYIRYYTDCSVMANNFLLTPQHLQKVDEVLHLNTLTSGEFLAQAPLVKYVLLRPFEIKQGEQKDLPFKSQLNRELLFGSPQALPPQFELLYQIDLPELETVYAKLYRIQRNAPMATPPAASSLDVGE